MIDGINQLPAQTYFFRKDIIDENRHELDSWMNWIPNLVMTNIAMV